MVHLFLDELELLVSRSGEGVKKPFFVISSVYLPANDGGTISDFRLSEEFVDFGSAIGLSLAEILTLRLPEGPTT